MLFSRSNKYYLKKIYLLFLFYINSSSRSSNSSTNYLILILFKKYLLLFHLVQYYKEITFILNLLKKFENIPASLFDHASKTLLHLLAKIKQYQNMNLLEYLAM